MVFLRLSSSDSLTSSLEFQDTFASMRDRYYMEGHGFLIVYSVTDSTSLQDAKDRYEGILTVTVKYMKLKSVIFVQN